MSGTRKKVTIREKERFVLRPAGSRLPGNTGNPLHPRDDSVMPGQEKNRLYTNGTVFALLLIALLAFAAPVTAATITINPGNPIQAVVNNATSGDTIILNPGTYFQSNIPISKTITIRANTSYGGTAANTIIDGTKSGFPIFAVSSGSVTLDSLTFTNSSAGNGGAIYNNAVGMILSITNSAFTGCSAGNYGGAIYNDAGTFLSITNSAFTGCSAGNYGGAIFNSGTISSITNSVFTDCSAGTEGGAIHNAGGPISSITNTTFTGCSADYGGAIYNAGGTVIESISFSRFYSNTAPNGPAISNYGTLTSSINNWWGTNADPGSSFSGSGGGAPTTWLLLGVTPSQTSITLAQTATIRANLTFNSTGYNTVSLGNVPDGIPVAYSVSGITGTFAPAQGNTTTGANTTVFTPTSFGAGTIAVAVDGETISVPVTVTAIPLTGTGAITGTPQVGSTLTAGAVAPSGATYDLQWNRSASSTGPFTPIPGATGSTYTLTSADLGMYLEVNATGTGSYTGSVNSTPVGPVTAIPLTGIGAIAGTPQVGSTLTAGAVVPSGATYDLQWNRSASSTGPFTPISGATGSTYALTSADLGMYLEVNATGTGSYTGSINSTPVGPVTAAPTQTPPTSHGRQNTHSRSSGGSADVGYTGPQPTVMGYQPTQMATTQQPTGVPAVQQFSRPTLVAAVTPGTGTSAGFPVTIVALISGACVVVAGSAWYIRRWWIHRQNPALFKKYD